MIDYDDYSTKELKLMIAEGRIDEKDVIWFYANEWWSDEGE